MNRVFVERSPYASLCFYCLRQIGFMGGQPNPEFLHWSEELASLGADFSFRPPLAGGPLFTLLYQIPGSLNVQSPEELQSLFEELQTFVLTGSLELIIERYGNRANCWDKWYTPLWVEQLLRPLRGKEEQALAVIKRFISLISTVWSDYQAIYVRKLEQYAITERERFLRQFPVFDFWDRELRSCYPYSKFQLIICPESRSNASSLGPEQVVCGAIHSEEEMLNSLVHEVGVRYYSGLADHPETQRLLAEDYEAMLRLVEVDVCYRKLRMLSGLENDPFVRGMGLQDLLNWRREQNDTGDHYSNLEIWYHLGKAQGLL